MEIQGFQRIQALNCPRQISYKCVRQIKMLQTEQLTYGFMQLCEATAVQI
uniref:Uncharacterized protein n=1 Tax=Manihot esculenta TaxID=3983 RepID=A0A2C9V605_MANES